MIQKVVSQESISFDSISRKHKYVRQQNNDSLNNDSLNKLKIVIFDGSFETTAFIRRLVKGLVKANHDVYIFGFNEVLKNPVHGVNYIALGDSQNNWSFFLTSLKWGLKSKRIIHYLNLLIKGNKSTLKRRNLDAAINFLEPDIIHVQWVSHISLFEKHLAENKFKFVLSQRGYQTNVRPFVNAENFAYLQKWLPKFSGFHSVSKAISDVGNQLYSSTSKIDQVVYTGLDLEKYDFQSDVIKNNTLQIMSVGRPHWIKGYDYAIKACSLLDQHGIDFRYTIVGASGDEELLFLINDLGLQDKVELTNKLPQQEVFQLIKHADVFLLSSIEEGIANVAVEAMALGTPVISTDCGGMQELITHEKEGWIVPTRDAEAMAHQLIEFSQLPKEKIEEVKSAARKKVEQQHNELQMVEGMLELYEKV